MESLENQIAEWRRYLADAPAIDGSDVEELEDHLRDQIATLSLAGLSDEEAFLVAVRRLGHLDEISREFAREHSGRLWKQLVLDADEELTQPSGGWLEALVFAAGAAVAIVVALLVAGYPGEVSGWLPRNLGFFVVPFLAGYFARRRRLDTRHWLLSATPFVVAAVLVNLYPYRAGSATEVIVTIHLPVVLWFAVAYPYMDGSLRSPERRMDFVRFTGEWVIYYVLIALGGGVLTMLTVTILEPIGVDTERIVEWVLPLGAVGAAIVAAWLVESKQRIVENMAPVLAMLFTPLFSIMLTIAAVSYVASGVVGEFDRELVGVFDAMLLVVLGLVLYSTSARDPVRPVGLMDWSQLVAVTGALVLDAMVLGAMAARIGDLGMTPNRAAAIGLNVILFVNLTGTAWLSVRFLRGRVAIHRLERWQASYLPVFAVWAAIVVIVLPPVFAFG